MIQVNRIYLIFNRLVTKKFLVDTSDMQTLLFLCKYLVVFDDPPLYVPHLIAEIDSNLEQLP